MREMEEKDYNDPQEGAYIQKCKHCRLLFK